MKTAALIRHDRGRIVLECEFRPGPDIRSWAHAAVRCTHRYPWQIANKTPALWRSAAVIIDDANYRYMHRFLRRTAPYPPATFHSYYVFDEVRGLLDIVPVCPAD